MAPIHWAALKGSEACLRILLDKGADFDCLNGGLFWRSMFLFSSISLGLNSPLLLAAAYGHDTVARILIGYPLSSLSTFPLTFSTEKGADPMIRNLRDRDAVFMAVV